MATSVPQHEVGGLISEMQTLSFKKPEAMHERDLFHPCTGMVESYKPISFSICSSIIRGSTKTGLQAGVCWTAVMQKDRCPSRGPSWSSIQPKNSHMAEIFLILFSQKFSYGWDSHLLSSARIFHEVYTVSQPVHSWHTYNFHKTGTPGFMCIIAIVSSSVKALNSIKPLIQFSP